MAFFARPDLDNLQFKQLSGSTLTLSGQTQIVKQGGLELPDGIGGYIPVVTCAAVNQTVLTYIETTGGTCCLTLLPPSSGASTGIYTCASPTTCTVGGLLSGSSISNCGIDKILELILVPVVGSTISAPFNTFSIFPATTQYEVGTSISITGCSTFDRGSIAPQYCGTCCYRSGLPVSYNYLVFGSPSACTSSLSTNLFPFLSYPIQEGNNGVSGHVQYLSGETAAFRSDGSVCSPALPSGCTAALSINISGIYPYFYGTVASGGAPAGSNRPAATPALITGGTKVVASSTGTIAVTFNSTSDDYIWFAIPNASTSKTKWFVDALNNGNIGGAVTPGGNLFPAFCTVTGVTSTIWNNVGCSPQTYKLYISNYQTASSVSMQLRNT